MKHSRSCLALAMVLPALFSAGCRTPAGLESMERELRYQEDTIYQLQDYIRTYKSHLNACRTENESLRRKISGGGGTDAPDRLDDTGPSLLPAPAQEDGGGEGPPKIELPEGLPDFSATGGQHNAPAAATRPSVAVQPAAAAQPTAHAADSRQPADGARTVSHESPAGPVARMTINAQGTRAYDTDGAPGADGIRVLIEPRNAGGHIVRANGKVSIAVLARATNPLEGTRLARWHVPSEQLARHQSARGIELELPWPDRRPLQLDVLVFTRLITEDGLHLYADQPVDLSDTREPIVLPDPAAPVERTGRPAKAGEDVLPAASPAENATWRYPVAKAAAVEPQPVEQPTVTTALPPAARLPAAVTDTTPKETAAEKAATAENEPDGSGGKASEQASPPAAPTESTTKPVPAPKPAAKTPDPPPRRKRPEWAPYR